MKEMHETLRGNLSSEQNCFEALRHSAHSRHRKASKQSHFISPLNVLYHHHLFLICSSFQQKSIWTWNADIMDGYLNP